MSIAFFIYLAGVISSFDSFLHFVFGMSTFVYSLYTMGYIFANESYWDRRGKYYTWPIALIVSSAVVSCLIPSDKTMWIMAGAVAAEKMVESKIGKDTLSIIELKVENELNELKNKTVKP